MIRFVPLVLRNLLRKKTRTILTIGSIAIALFLFGLLATIETALGAGVEIAGVDRLVVRNKISLIMPLPYAYQQRIAQMPNVSHVTFANWFGGIYQDERNWFPQFAIDTETYRSVFTEFDIPDDQWQDFLDDRQGAVVGEGLADRFGWKVGDRIPIQGTIFQGTWEFNLRAIYKGTRPEDDTSQFWFQWKYLDERSQLGDGIVGWYTVKLDDPDHAVTAAAMIDDRFANSAWETSTETEQAFAIGFAKQIGNIRLIVLSVGTVVLFTLLLVTGNTMAMAVRERSAEMGVLKTLGFSDATVMVMVLAESLTLAGVGGGLGLGVVKLFTLGGDPTGGMLPVFYFAWDKMAFGFGLAIVVGLLAGAIPAAGAMRLRIVDALRRV
ncbi:MAG: FtsX-like permease family protein [bacterium]|nr:FtsX-like permease family protein [bacterium]